jgi:hypothetical protein
MINGAGGGGLSESDEGNRIDARVSSRLHDHSTDSSEFMHTWKTGAPMTSHSRAADLVGYSFLVMFANDGLIDADELHFLKRVALSDGEVDEAERRALRGIFARANFSLMSAEVKAEIEEFRTRYDI